MEIKNLTEVLTTVPELYNDGLKSTVKESGKTLSLLPRTINAALVPLQKWIMHKEYSLKETELLLQEKLKNIKPENIVTPEPYVGVPTLQAISYCMDCEELRNLYANLLSKSMNTDTKDDAHPAFVEIIKQLSPLDAQIINELELYSQPNKSLPIGLFRYCKELKTPNYNFSLGSRGITLLKHAFEFNNIDTSFDLISASMENIMRLGLISIDYTRSIAKDGTYDNLKNGYYFEVLSSYCNDGLKYLPEYQDYELVFNEGILQVTQFGYLFGKVCCIT